MIYNPPIGDNLSCLLKPYNQPYGDMLHFDFRELKVTAYAGGTRNTFYVADMTQAIFTMSLSENSDFPLTNLNSNLPTLIWKSSASTNGQSLIIDLGYARACDFIAIAYHNYAPMDSVSFQYSQSDNSNFADPITIANLKDLIVLNVIEFSEITKRYFRILFEECNGVTPELGLIYIGKGFTIPISYNLDFEIGNKKFETNVKSSLSGMIRTERQIAGRERLEVTYQLIDDATVIGWLSFMDKVKGRCNPFFYKDGKDKLHLVHFEDDYVPVKGRRANVNDLVRLKMSHQTIN